MEYFTERHGELTVEDVALSAVAEQYGTPTYVYSRAAITDNYLAWASALGDHPGMICYAVKANSNLAVLNALVRLGAGFDIVSGGELERVLRAGADPARVVFSGLGKTREEMVRALEVGIHCFNVESEPELELLSETASALGLEANVSVRVNPDVDAKTHPYISTGLKNNKFGIAFERAPAVYRRAAELPGIRVQGVDCHIGSQLTELCPFLDALDRLLVLVDELAASGISINHLDLGGGLGVNYQGETPPAVADYLGAVKARLGDRPLTLLFEPGRSIVANAGVLLTRVLYLKPSEHRNFAIIDAAMNDNLRPALYQAWQSIRPVRPGTGEAHRWDLVGPVCESADFLGKDRELVLSPGDLLAVMSAGAYGFAMSSNYNTRNRAAEVMVDGDQTILIRERETLDHQLRGEHLLPDGD